jgi:geranylgeranyl diphosphate synthase type II
MIHTYSLVHDDLPAIDNDIIRRGNPTTHIKFGEALGIFAGDGLLTDAIEIMVNACKDESAKDALECFNKIEAMRIIVAAAGGKGMLGGQVIDKQYEDDSIPLDLLETMHRLKTGSLIKASVLTAATICNADNETKDGLEHFSDELGLTFQIKDDILDAEGDCQTLGKTVGKDLINNKKTYASMYGIEKAKILLEEKSNSACAHLKEISRRLPDADFAFLVDLTCYLASRQL